MHTLWRPCVSESMQLNAVSRRMQRMQKKHMQLKCSCPPNAKNAENAYAAEMQLPTECKKCICRAEMQLPLENNAENEECSLECTINAFNCHDMCECNICKHAKNVHGQKPSAFLGKNHKTPVGPLAWRHRMPERLALHERR